LVALPFSASRVSFGFRESVQAFLGRPDLPFASQLDPNQIHEVFSKHNALFGGLYTTAIVLWAFMGQVLSDGKEASCQSAVAKISAYFARLGRKVPRADTGAYCRARIKLPEAALRELSHLVAKGAQEQYDLAKKWKNRNVYLVDGFTFQMPDTPRNQRKYPQHSAQKPGLGFPIARVVALISLATGCVVDLALGPYKGKATGESALFRSLLHQLQPGDVVVADRHYCSYAMVWALIEKGVHVCFRQHQARHTDFRKGKRLGKYDHVVAWSRGPRPAWMTNEDYDKLPMGIVLREVRYVIEEPGRKQEPFIVVTTLLEPMEDAGATKDELASLYGFRWNVELDIRSIKSNMNLGHLRCKSPEMVHREFWVSILAYNLIRTTIAIAATIYQKEPRQLSFTSACQYVLAGWQELRPKTTADELQAYCLTMLERISECVVANRPGRFEPRVVKRRRDQYTLMMEPRNELRKRLAMGDNAFE
jgi:putative transposase